MRWTPSGGSHAVAYLTDEIERRAQAYIDKIDAMGRAVGAIGQGYFRQEIVEAADRCQQAVERKEQVAVGVNACRTEEETLKLDRPAVAPAVEGRQRARLAELRAWRDAEQASVALARIETAGRASDGPLVPLLIVAVQADCTLGEISKVDQASHGRRFPMKSSGAPPC